MYSSVGFSLEAFRYMLNAECSEWKPNLDPETDIDPVDPVDLCRHDLEELVIDATS